MVEILKRKNRLRFLTYLFEIPNFKYLLEGLIIAMSGAIFVYIAAGQSLFIIFITTLVIFLIECLFIKTCREICNKTEDFRRALIDGMNTKIVRKQNGEIYFKFVLYNHPRGKKHIRNASSVHIENLEENKIYLTVSLRNRDLIILKRFNNTDRIRSIIMAGQI